MRIVDAVKSHRLGEVRELFLEYAANLGFSLFWDNSRRGYSLPNSAR